MNWQPSNPTMRALLNAFIQEAPEIYAVGGFVRDQLLGKTKDLADLDLVTSYSAMAISKQVADRVGWAYYPLDEGRDMGRLVFTANVGEPLVCDVARMRGDTIETDLLARDFTINAMAVAYTKNQAPRLIDVVGGEADLKQKLVRRVNMASLAEDPVRMLRAVRLCQQLGFSLDVETRQQIERISDTLNATSPERLRDELWKIMALEQPDQGLEELRRLGLLRHALPELSATVGVEQSAPHTLDVYQHTLYTIRYARILRDWLKGVQPLGREQQALADLLQPYLFFLRQHFLKPIAGQRLRADWLVWLALFHDIGKPTTRTAEISADGTVRYHFFEHDLRGAEMTVRRLERMRFSRNEIDLADAVIRGHMRPHLLDLSFRKQALSRRACYRFFRDIGAQNSGGQNFADPAGIDTLLLALADVQAMRPSFVPETWQEYCKHVGELLYFAYSDETAVNSRQKPFVDGHSVMRHTGIQPGKPLGEVLEAIFEAQVAGEVTSPEEALMLASQLVRDRKN